MQPPVNLKGFYTSQKKGDKLFQEGIFTIFNEIEEIHVELDTMLKLNGSQVAPARSSYDLFLCQPSFTQGAYKMLSCKRTTLASFPGHYQLIKPGNEATWGNPSCV